MKLNNQTYTKSVVFIALLAMFGQIMAVCCSDAVAAVATHPDIVAQDSKPDCHTQAPLDEGGLLLDQINNSSPQHADHDCENADSACCSQITAAIKSDDVKSRKQLNNTQFDFDAVLIDQGLLQPSSTPSDWRLLSEYQKPHQSIPFYISYCSFLE